MADDIVAKLRQRVKERPDDTGPSALTSWMVKNKLLTSFQADELLNNGSTVQRFTTTNGAVPLAEIVDDADGLAGAFAAPMSFSQPRLNQPRPAKAAPIKANAWDSKLMLLGGGGLLVLLLAFGALYWLIGRGSGDEAFQLAQDDYDAGNYTQAIEKYNRYLENHPSHQSAGLARVNRGLARLRQISTRPADWVESLAETETILPEIRKEREFSDARAELATILPKLVDGLIAQARAKQDPAVLLKADHAFNLVQNNAYVPKALRNDAQLRIAESQRAEVQRELDRDRELASSVDEITAAAARGDTASGYEIRRDLVRTYPDLENHPALRKAILAVAAAEQQAVEYVLEPTGSAPDEPDSAISAVTAMASTQGKAAPGAQGKRVFALAAGAAYGLEASGGKPLWRRFVGFDTAYLPSPVPGAENDVLLIDGVRGELVRADAASGAARWRAPLEGGLPLPPVLAGETAWVATRGGRVYRVNLADGNSSGYFQLPQPILTMPAFSASLGMLYVVGQEGNLYVLDAGQDPHCRTVVYLGHGPDTIVAPPVLIDELYLLLAENTGLKYSSLRVLKLLQEGADAKLVQSEPLAGQVHTPPMREGNSALVATDSGGLYVFAIGDAQADQPLAAVTRQTGGSAEGVAPYLYVQRDKLWVAQRVLQHYDFQESTGQFTPLWQRFAGDVFLQPLQAVGPVLVYARRAQGKPGVVVGAIDAAQGETYWETTLAAPSATGPLVDPETRTIAALTSSGDWFEMPLASVEQSQLLSQPHQQVATEAGLTTDYPVSRFEGGRWALSLGPDGRQLLTASKAAGKTQLAWTDLPDAVTFPPTAQAGRLLAAGGLGQVYFLDPDSWQPAGEPFQPVLENGRRYRWLGAHRSMADAAAPAARSEGEEVSPPTAGQVLLAEQGGDLYSLALASEPIPHLAAQAQAKLEWPLIGPLAEVGAVAYAVDQEYRLLAIQRADLQLAPVVQLTGPPIWGPQRVGDVVIVATEDDQLLCLDGSGQVRWRQSLLYGPLAGEPAVLGDRLILASTTGTVWSVDRQSGAEIGALAVGEPLARGVVVANDEQRPRLLLTAADGALLVTDVP